MQHSSSEAKLFFWVLKKMSAFTWNPVPRPQEPSPATILRQ